MSAPPPPPGHRRDDDSGSGAGPGEPAGARPAARAEQPRPRSAAGPVRGRPEAAPAVHRPADDPRGPRSRLRPVPGGAHPPEGAPGGGFLQAPVTKGPVTDGPLGHGPVSHHTPFGHGSLSHAPVSHAPVGPGARSAPGGRRAAGGSISALDRAHGALLGLAVGDALGAPAENMKPSEIRRRWGRIEGFVSDDPAGTDDTEYTIFSGLLLAEHGAALTVEQVEAAWHRWIADLEDEPFRGAGFSERGTLENLRRGLAAPISAQHRHAWSDGLAMRAAPFGVFAAGRPAEAARLVEVDGTVSHDGEGIYGGQAVAAGVAAAMAGAGMDAVVAAALSVVPEDSWTARSLRRAVVAAQRSRLNPELDQLATERAVRSAVVIGGYPWTDLAPEAVGLAFGAFISAGGDFTGSVLTAVNMGRDADTTAGVAGALAGALNGVDAIPEEWASAITPARGTCLPSTEGHHVLDIATLLTSTTEGRAIS